MATITSTTSGNWNTGTTWVGGVAPADTDDVVIANTHTVTISSTDSSAKEVCASIDINTGGQLNVTDFALEITDNTSSACTVDGTLQLQNSIEIGTDGATTNAVLAIGSGGVLNVPYNTSNDVTMSMYGRMSGTSGCSFKVGDKTNPLDSARTFTYSVESSTICNSTITPSDFFLHGTDCQFYAVLNTEMAIDAKSMVLTGTPSGWADSDTLIIGRYRNENPETTTGELITINDATPNDDATVTVAGAGATGGVGATKGGESDATGFGAIVLNYARGNIIFKTNSSGNAQLAITTSHASCDVYMQNVRSDEWGGTISSVAGWEFSIGSTQAGASIYIDNMLCGDVVTTTDFVYMSISGTPTTDFTCTIDKLYFFGATDNAFFDTGGFSLQTANAGAGVTCSSIAGIGTIGTATTKVLDFGNYVSGFSITELRGNNLDTVFLHSLFQWTIDPTYPIDKLYAVCCNDAMDSTVAASTLSGPGNTGEQLNFFTPLVNEIRSFRNFRGAAINGYGCCINTFRSYEDQSIAIDIYTHGAWVGELELNDTPFSVGPANRYTVAPINVQVSSLNLDFGFAARVGKVTVGTLSTATGSNELINCTSTYDALLVGEVPALAGAPWTTLIDPSSASITVPLPFFRTMAFGNKPVLIGKVGTVEKANYGYPIDGLLVHSLDYGSITPHSDNTDGMVLDPVATTATTDWYPYCVLRFPVSAGASSVTLKMSKSNASWSGRLEFYWGANAGKPYAPVSGGQNLNPTLATYTGADGGWTDVTFNFGTASRDSMVEVVCVCLDDPSNTGSIYLSGYEVVSADGLPFVEAAVTVEGSTTTRSLNPAINPVLRGSR